MQGRSKIHTVLVVLAIILAVGVIVEGYFLVRGDKANVAGGGTAPAQTVRVQAARQGGMPAQAPDADPYEEMLMMQQKIDRMFQEMMARRTAHGALPVDRALLSPMIDTKETETEYVIICDLPGMEQDKINIYIEGDRLVIKGVREVEKEIAGAQGAFRAERRFGSFQRAVPLPHNTEKAGMKAEYKNGVLTIIVPKTAPAAPPPAAGEGNIL